MNEPVYTSVLDTHDTNVFLTFALAQLRSKDPRTKVGAHVYHPRSGGSFFGYNGFPAGYPDAKRFWDCRDQASPDSKYRRVVHAEVNAVRKAQMALGLLDGCELYVTHFPCHNCMKDAVVPSGIRKVYYVSDEHFDDLSAEMARYSNVELVRLAMPANVRLVIDA